MGYYSATNLSCTKPELIASGSTFNQNTTSELLEVKDGKAYYRTLKRSMFNEIYELSEMHPEETFTITWWWDDDYYKRVIWTEVFIDGKYKEMKVEPGYVFIPKEDFRVDKALIYRFHEVLLKYVKRIDLIREDPEDGIVFDRLNDQNFFDDDFRSHFQIIWENEDHKFVGTNKDTFDFEIEYEKKDPGPEAANEKRGRTTEYYGKYGPVPF